MIDIHCHIIPGVDDGSDSSDTSLMMAAMAADDGVDAIIATPHFMHGGEDSEDRFNNLKSHAAALQNMISTRGMPLKIYCGSEVLLTPDTVNMFSYNGFFPRMNGTDYSLVEFFFDSEPDIMKSHLKVLIENGVVPVIAHPERYTSVAKKKKIVFDWLDMGCFLQVNKGSFQGQFGRPAQKTAVWLMENRLPSFLATDAHNIAERSTRLSGIINHLSELYGDDYLSLLTDENPKRLLKGEPILKF
ncbi:MAG: hypothetical protein LUH54_04625 [Firmicutes bacterium]|nr:hypothetical protein [Bacillota bacterium]